MLSDSVILKHIARQPKRSAGFKQLVRELGLHGAERNALDDLLRKLVSTGALIQDDSDRYALPQAAADKNLVAGRLTMHRDGFGFVIPDAKSLSPSLRARLTSDIFIPPHLMGNAMHGDLVLVDIANVRPDGRAEGRIVRPVRRAHPTVVGTFHRGAHIRRARGCVLDRVWSAAVWLEKWRHRLPRQHYSPWRLRAHGRSGSYGD